MIDTDETTGRQWATGTAIADIEHRTYGKVDIGGETHNAFGCCKGAKAGETVHLYRPAARCHWHICREEDA